MGGHPGDDHAGGDPVTDPHMGGQAVEGGLDDPVLPVNGAIGGQEPVCEKPIQEGLGLLKAELPQVF